MSQLKVNSVVDASGGNTATINTYTPTESNMGGKNRIINGDMRIDQRNAGAAVTSASAYVVDRFQVGRFATDELAWSIQRDSSAPTGFVNSTKVTITTAESTFTTNENSYFNQPIEGTNVSDLAWGSASAKTVTLSFWVRSSLTGTFGGCLYNSAADRFYPFSYSISAANTWEQKSVTIAGDTSGTWLTTTGIGIVVQWSLGAGPDRLGTAGAWTASAHQGVTGQVQVSANLNATWYVTGVQFEVGSVATPFERRDYGRELMLCQRYYEKSYIQTDAVGAANKGGYTMSPVGSNTVPLIQGYAQICFAVVKRADPTITFYGYQGGAGKVSNGSSGADLAANSGALNASGTQGFNGYNASGGTLTTAQFAIIYHWTASIEL